MIVLDTNVLSEAMKPAPASAVALWMTRQRAQSLFTTAVSEAEILLGIAILPEGRRKQELETAAKQNPRTLRGAHSRLRHGRRTSLRRHCRRTPESRTAYQRFRCSDRSDCPLTRHGPRHPQCTRLRRRGRYDHRSMGRVELVSSSFRLRGKRAMAGNSHCMKLKCASKAGPMRRASAVAYPGSGSPPGNQSN